MKSDVIQFAGWGDTRHFAPGDILSNKHIVVKIDHERKRMHVRPATRAWRALMWIRTAPKRAWRWVVFQFYSLLP